MGDAIARALLLGLSTGAFCVASCAPVFVPLMLAEERRQMPAKFLPFLQFSLGRLLAYAMVGVLAGWLGRGTAVRVPSTLAGISLLGLASLMIIYGLQGGFPQWRMCRILAPAMSRVKTPFLLGVFLGVNLCPPFLVALADVYLNGRIGYGLVFFLVFFLVTTLFLLPFTLLGYLAKFPSLRTVAQLAAVVVGVLYLLLGLLRFSS